MGEKGAGTLAIIALLAVRLPDSSLPKSLSFAEQLAGWAVPVAIIALLAQVGGRLLRSMLGAPAIWGTVHEMLDHLRDEILGNELDASPQHAHRATLFKRRLALPWPPVTWLQHGWLVPVERSGYTTRRRTCRWRAGDDSSEAEGIAGTAWVNNGVIVVTHEDLPDPAEPGLSSEEVETRIEEYASKTFVSKDWVRDHLRRAQETGPGLPRYFCGIPVLVKGKPWGVIVIDSTSKSLRDAEEVRRIYRLSGKALGSLLTHDGILKRG
ncbi:MAG: hypothetical protein ACLF0P_11300 [Thermoanaerobaculia bacterium]